MVQSGFGRTAIGQARGMTIGGSLFVIALGAILRYAVKDTLQGVDLPTVGLILMVVGLVGLLFGIYYAFVAPA